MNHANRRNVAVFIDLENMFGGYRNGVSGVPLSRMLREIHQFIEELHIGSSAATTKAYANWMVAGMTTYRREMLENGVEPVQIFSYTGTGKNPNEGRRKNAADVQIVVDALTVAVEAPWVDVFVIVSGDGDYIPLVRRLQYLGKYVIGATLTGADAGAVNSLLRSNADHYFEIDAGSARATFSDATHRDSSTSESEKTLAAGRLPSDRTPTLEEYVQSAREIVAQDERMMRSGEVDGALLGNALRTHWPRVSFATFKFRTLGDFVENGCGLKIYRPGGLKVLPSKATPAATGAVSGPLPGSERPIRDSLRKLLEAVEPTVVYPKLVSLTSVLEELTIQFEPIEPEALSDALGNDLAEVPAEQIRLALSLLYAVGAFRVEDDSKLMLTSDVNSVKNGIDLALSDARRRAETIELYPSDQEIEQAIFDQEE